MNFSRQEAELKLKNIFGLDHFYDEQWQAIQRILNGERILMIQKTGFGKSLCYQFPATQFPGITVIFSPLIALMRDQVNALRKRGISAAYINSEQTNEENQAAIQQALQGKIKILYIAPERQENKEWIDATREMNLSMVVIDEAHTISTWGHDFRPSFQRIIELVQLLPKHLPILATTATATKRVQADIEKQIGGKLTTIRGSLIRKNLHLHVIKVQSDDDKMRWLAENINKIEGSGLIYTGTRVDTEIYAKWLQFVGINAIDYNAGLDADSRKKIEAELMQNKRKCVVSTNALGMGIDKPDIRFIIHTQIPVSPIHYYQETGRAGRDGKPTQIILFYNEAINKQGNPTDYQLPLSFIESARPPMAKYLKVIELLKEEPLSERGVIMKANLKQTQVRVIKADLINQGIIKEVLYNKTKKYEYQYNAPALDYERFEELRKTKIKELDAMVGYVYTNMPRMKYLCQFLDSDEASTYSNCDNTNLPPLYPPRSTYWNEKLEQFRETYYPLLELADTTTIPRSGWKIKIPYPYKIELIHNDKLVATYTNTINYQDFSVEDRDLIKKVWDKHIEKASHIVDGYASSYYGVTNVGEAIHRCKYENGGDFPNFLLTKTLSMFYKKFRGVKIDLILYVPPTHSGNLVKNFAEKFASSLNIPLCHNLRKTRDTQEQKIFQNSYSKRENVLNAFEIEPYLVKNKTVVVIDDIYDSGATLQEIGSLLTSHGANYIIPIVIAKTVGATL